MRSRMSADSPELMGIGNAVTALNNEMESYKNILLQAQKLTDPRQQMTDAGRETYNTVTRIGKLKDEVLKSLKAFVDSVKASQESGQI